MKFISVVAFGFATLGPITVVHAETAEAPKATHSGKATEKQKPAAPRAGPGEKQKPRAAEQGGSETPKAGGGAHASEHKAPKHEGAKHQHATAKHEGAKHDHPAAKHEHAAHKGDHQASKQAHETAKAPKNAKAGH
jgi:hypothetical protein